MPAQYPVPEIFTGGQMTDLPAYGQGSFSGTELMEIVSPGTAALGVNYAITTELLALYLLNVATIPTIIQNEAVYDSVATDTRILVKNSGAFTTGIVLLTAQSYAQPILVKDLSGFASDVNPITVTFSGGQTMDGMTSVSITNPYGWYWFNPLAAGNFYGS